MTLNGWLQIALFMAVVLLLAKPMGTYMAAVFERRKTFLDPVLGPGERRVLEAQFPPLPATVKSVYVYFPHTSPIADVPVTP